MMAMAWNKANATVLPSCWMISHASCLAVCFAISLLLHGCDDPLDPQASFLFIARTTTTPAPGGAPTLVNLDSPAESAATDCDDTSAPINGHTTTCGNRWKWLRSEQGYSTEAAKCKLKEEEPVNCACLQCGQVSCDDTPAPVPGHPSTTCGSRWQWLRSNQGFSTEAAKCKVKDEEQAKCACLTCTQAPATTTTKGVVPPTGIRVVNRQIVVNGAPLHMKGVNWNPIGKGGSHPAGLDFSGYVAQDAQLMASAGINVVRTYDAITDISVLDTLWSHGIYVISTVYGYGASEMSTIAPKISPVRNHPAILMWAVGNEWNYNGLYVNMNFNDARAKVREAVRAVKQVDSSHPVTTIYGELPSSDTITFLSDVDVWGVNVYRGIGFGDLFQKWAALSGLPMYLGEYGADAYDARVNRENQAAQAQATTTLTQAIVDQSSVTGGVCSGGIIFEFADEWWKAGSPNTHDTGGVAPGGGPYPDNTFNEEWWGLVDIDRSPRQAYTAFANIVTPGASTSVPSTTLTLAPTTSSVATTTAQGLCDETTWPDKDHGLVCGDCKVLVNSFDSKYQNCDGYCSTLGMDCAGAWEERSDTCTVAYDLTCSQKLASSDAICQCKQRLTTTTPMVSCDDTPAPIPGYPSTTCGSRWQWLHSNQGLSTAAAKCKVKDEDQVKCACLACTQAPATTTTKGVAPPTGIRVVNRQIVVNGAPLHMKGVNWNPVGKGGSHPADLDFSGFVVQDAQLMARAGINVVRTYDAITDTSVLDTLWSHGIYVISTVYGYGADDISTVAQKVAPVKNHPAILMWAVGNEWNYNGLYVNLNFNDARTKVRDAVRAVKHVDSNHPVTTIYGELPSSDTITFLSDVDVWGVNVYRGIGFGDLFQKWAALSGLPMYLGEYGADAYDARVNQENQAAQAQATTALTQLIVAQSSVTGGVCSGGIIFELADEWWKAGSPSTHDTGGVAPGGGPYPDNTFNEEWWGLVDVDRSPRQAYTAYANIATPGITTGPKGCAVFGESGMQTWKDCSNLLTSHQQGSSLPSAPTGQLNWVCRVDRGRVMILDGQGHKAHMWDVAGQSFNEVSLGALHVPVGCVYLDGKVYVAGFGSWPVPNGDSGVAVVNAATGQLENFVPYPDSKVHVHNVYSFNWNGQDEIFVAALGNPWTNPPLPGSGLVKFDRQLNTFATGVAAVRLNARSAVQQSADVFYIVTQEPAGQRSKLARLERDGDGFKLNAEQLLPSRTGGDGGADVLLSAQSDVVFSSDRTANGGKVYAYRYNSGAFTRLSSHNTGNHPRYTTSLTNGDVVACNQNSKSLTVFTNLFNRPSAWSIPTHTVSTSNIKPMFFMDKLDIQN